MKALLRVFAYLRPYWWICLIGIVCLGITDGLQLVTPKLIGWAVDELTDGTADHALLFRLGGAIVIIAFVVGLFRLAWRQTIIRSSFRVEQTLRNTLFTHLQTLSMSFYDTNKTGDLMARATNDIRVVQRTAGIGLVLFADFLIMGTASIAFMLSINARMTLLALTPLVLITAFILLLDRSLRRRFKAVQDCFSDLTERVRENLSGVRVIKAFVQEEAEIRGFAEISDEYRKKNLAVARLWAMFFPMIMFFGGLGLATVLYFGGKGVIGASLSLGDFVAFAAYLGMLMWPMMAIGWVVNIMQRGSVSMTRIAEILDTLPTITEHPDPVRPDEVKGRITFQNLTFTYDNVEVLRDISLDILPGETIGIVGGIGAGKSSLINLLLRIYDPPPDTVLIDQKDIRRLATDVVRKNVVCVPQEPFLFSGTLAENISFSLAEAGQERIERAARAACIHDAIAAFPDGYESVVGERGVTLSGGEKQRVSIARALITDAPIVIFDDSLSAVDTHTEAAILRHLTESTRDRTSLIISHRISAVEKADKIIVLEGGRITETGTHEELIRSGGWYFRMYRRQQVQIQLGLDPAAEAKKKREQEAGPKQEEEEEGHHEGHSPSF